MCSKSNGINILRPKYPPGGEGAPHPPNTQKKRASPENLDKRHRLDSSHVEPFSAADILAPHQVIPSHHVALRLRKPCPVAVIRSTRQLRFFAPHQPA